MRSKAATKWKKLKSVEVYTASAAACARIESLEQVVFYLAVKIAWHFFKLQ